MSKYDDLSDEELALLAYNGEHSARDILYERLGDAISARTAPARHLLKKVIEGSEAAGPVEIEDLEQSLFLMFCDLLAKWQPARTPFVPYVTTMIRWSAYRFVRSSLHLRSSRIKAVRLTEACQFEREQHNDAASDPFQLIEGSEEWNALLSQLKGDWKRLVNLKFHEDLSTKEIAHIANRSPRTVNRTLRAALELLRQNALEDWEAV